ncbi:MAG: metallophosphoesterase family protein [Thermofilum sp.]
MGRLRILALSDVHGKEDIVQSFLNWVKKDNVSYDIIVAAGDIGNPQRPGSMCRALRALAEGLGKNVYYVKGNWDVEGECGCQRVYDLDQTGPVIFGDVLLVGHGRRAEPHDFPAGARSSVLVTHYPPFSILDKGKLIDSYKHSLHAGIPEINYLVDKYKPLVHIFGHSHSFGGLEIELNGVKYVNVARLDRLAKNGEPMGNYAIIDVSSAGVRVEWRFINGVWKKCAGCGRIVHIPEKWSMCRKCANKAEVKVVKLQGARSRYVLKLTDSSSGNLLLQKDLYIPVHTIGDKAAFEDFLDLMILRNVKNLLQADGARVMEIPKDKVLEYYRAGRGGSLTPFSEYLFACNPAEGGERLCALMKVFSSDKRAHVLWKVREGSSMTVDEYILFSEDALLANPELPQILLRAGFTPLTYSLGAL